LPRFARPERATVYVLGITVCGAAVAVYSAVDLVRHPVGIGWLILVCLTVASGWAMLRIPSMPISFSISDIFNIVAALIFGPSAGAISAALDGLVVTSRFAHSQRTLNRILFNMAAPTIATWVAAQVFFALGRGHALVEGPLALVKLLGLLVVFGAIDFGLNSGLVATAVGFERRLPVVPIWREHFAGMWITYFGGIFGAMLLMVLSRFHTLDIIVLLVPLPVILYVTFRHAIGRAEDQLNHLAKVNRVYVAAIEALAHAVDAKDQVTHDHTRRVQDQAVRLARALHVEDESQLQTIKAAALLHDVGKLAIPEHILNKPGRLTPAEFDIMKRHAAIGADILSVIGLPYAVAPIVRHHHENWDGTGYPDGIAGDQIPVGSRILAVVDCFDALTSDRPYRPRMETDVALRILSERRGTMYDAEVVDAFFLLQAAPASFPAMLAPAADEADQISAGAVPQPPVDDREDLEFQTVFELGRTIGGLSLASELGEILWNRFKEHIPASAFVLYTYDEFSDAIVSMYDTGGAIACHATKIPLGERLSGWVAATGQTAMNSDARLDFEEAAREGSALRTALVVPITRGGLCAGVLSFYAESPNAFDDGHRRFAERVSKLVGDTAAEATVSEIDYVTVSRTSTRCAKSV
jgi:putative nucleotidyltransferase with HDIG domain